MSKQYTRLQIENAINYWAKQLFQLDHQMLLSEANSKIVIDRLEQEFGKDVVYSSELEYSLTQKDLEKIFQILNETLFDNKLTTVDIRYVPENVVVNELNRIQIESEVYDRTLYRAPCYGVHSAVSKDIKDSDGNVIDVNIYGDVILINSSLLTKCVFIFAVACICHEMIHYYDRFSEEYYRKAVKSSQTGISFNAHQDAEFIHMKQIAINAGINVIESPNKDDTYKSLNDDARYALKRVMGETDTSDNVIIAQNPQMLIMRTKGSDKFFIANFD